MTEDLRISQLDLQYLPERRQLSAFLKQNGLMLEDDAETVFGVLDVHGRLLACGCAAGRLLKCFAVDNSLRGENILGALVSRLVQERFSEGIYDLAVITRSNNLPQFSQCGMYPVAEGGGLALLENRPDGPERFAAQLRRPEDQNCLTGAVVMNCNPFTKGHRALVEYAAANCQLLYLFVVEEDRSLFSASDRLKLVQEGVADLANVRVALSGNYMISSATFPNYFIKQDEDATTLQAELDAAVFAKRIAPALHISRRFAGQEPLDGATARYNDVMRRILPAYGVSFQEIPRLTQNGTVISASHLRDVLAKHGLTDEVLDMVPETTARYLRQKWTSSGIPPKSDTRGVGPCR